MAEVAEFYKARARTIAINSQLAINKLQTELREEQEKNSKLKAENKTYCILCLVLFIALTALAAVTIMGVI